MLDFAKIHIDLSVVVLKALPLEQAEKAGSGIVADANLDKDSSIDYAGDCSTILELTI